MKHSLHLALLSVAVSALSLSGAKAIDEVDGVYQIGTAADLTEFNALVTAGNDTANAVLTADIDMSGVETTPIGKAAPAEEGVHYRGTFDGQGHRISNLVLSNTDWEYMGLFGMVTGGAVIKNLILDSSCSFSGKCFVGGFAGGSVGGGFAAFLNCGNEATVTGTNQNVAGIVGVAMDSSCPFIMVDCYNSGSVSGANESAALTGWGGNGSYVVRSWNTGTISGVDGDNKLHRGTVTTYGLYDLEGKQGTKFGEDSLASGALTYMLNSNSIPADLIANIQAVVPGGAADYIISLYQNGGATWFQNLDNGAAADAQPVFDYTHGRVYTVGQIHCNGDLYEGITFSNTDGTVKDSHDFIGGVCSYCDSVDMAWFAPADSVYEIADAAHLNWFAHYVNKLNGEKAYARLTSDIDFTEYSQQGVIIGLGGHDFTGWFDGQGHTVTIDYPESLNAQYVSLFRFVKAGTVKNLITEGTVATSQKFGAGLAAYLVGSDSRVENCISRVTITSSVDGDATNGGISAISNGSGVYNSAFFGALDGSTACGSAGIIGWAENSAPVVRCLVNAPFRLNLAEDSPAQNAMMARGSSAQQNCFYVNPDGGELPDNGTAATQATLEQLASGELTYMLNEYRSDSVSWYQNLDVEAEADATPVPFSGHATVYAVGHLHCNNTPYEGEITYSNAGSSVADAHDFVGGICSYCGTVDGTYMASTDGYYEISNAEQLNWFARYVSAGHVRVNAKLTADIDFSQYTQQGVTVGQTEDQGTNFFRGIFDGQNHTVTVSYSVAEPAKHQSLIAVVAENGVVRNLKTTGTVTGKARITGGITGLLRNATMENCYSDVNFDDDYEGDATLGGLSGDAQDYVLFRNSAYTGTMSAPASFGNGGLCGYANGGIAVVFENCYVAGSFAVNNDGGANSMFCRNNPTLKNCYYTDNGVLGIETRGVEVSGDQVQNGELAFLLNESKSGAAPWAQAIGTDNYPQPLGGSLVYAIGTVNCDGTPLEVSYSNAEGTLTQNAHSYNADGICETCGGYLISTSQQLLDCSQAINSGFSNANVGIIINSDLDMTGIEGYEGIGCEAFPYAGKFDGQGHTISHLVVDAPEADYRGLFAVLGGDAEIRNILVDSTCSFRSRAFAGGIAGGATGTGLTVIENCGNEAPVATVNQNAGGVIGVLMGSTTYIRITNCYNAGAVTGGNESAGISGWLGSGSEITSCFNIGPVTGVDGVRTFARHDRTPKYTNCFESAAVGSQIDTVTVEQIESGALCFMLNDSVSGADGPYYQKIGTDKHPRLFGSDSKVYEKNGRFANTEITNSIKAVAAGGKDGDVIVRIYSVDGVSLPALQKGVNIVRYKNGTVKKLFVK